MYQKLNSSNEEKQSTLSRHAGEGEHRGDPVRADAVSRYLHRGHVLHGVGQLAVTAQKLRQRRTSRLQDVLGADIHLILSPYKVDVHFLKAGENHII